jgi:3-oxoacyl-[acyl-carrier-protein] synthase II
MRRRAEPVSLIAAGAVTPFGPDLDAFWSGLITGSDGISMIERFPVDDLRVGRGGEIKKLRALPGTRRVGCRATQLLFAAAEDLLARAPIAAEPERIAVVLGTALGGVGELERALTPRGRFRHAAGALYDSPAHALARRLGARGPVLTVGAACAAGATAMGNGADLLRAGVVDVVVAGGYDALCRFVMRGFDALRSLTRESVRPFDRRRSGLLLGEAAAAPATARTSRRPTPTAAASSSRSCRRWTRPA